MSDLTDPDFTYFDFVDGVHRFCTRLYKTETPKSTAVCDLDL